MSPECSCARHLSPHWTPQPTTNINHWWLTQQQLEKTEKTLQAKTMFIIIQQILLNIGFIAHCMAGTAAATLGCRSEKSGKLPSKRQRK